MKTDVINLSAQSIQKEIVTVPERLRPYLGRSPHVVDPLMRAAYTADITFRARFYPPGTADWDQKATQVLLNHETADWLYSQFTPLTTRYVAGSRPVLERIVGRLIRPGMTEREKVMAIMGYAWKDFREEWVPLNARQNLPILNPCQEKFIVLNATEEEILKFGGKQCDNMSRLTICLCQVAGFPARFVASYGYFKPEKGYTSSGGHAIVEIYLEDGWAFFDSIQSYYWLKPDEHLASLWDLVRDPGLSSNQPETVLRDCDKTREQFIRYHEMNLTCRQVITITNYSVWDSNKYDWQWMIYDGNAGSPFDAEVTRMAAKLQRKALESIGISQNKIT